MEYKRFFLDNDEPYLVLVKNDMEELLSNDYLQVNIAIELDALPLLRFYPNIKKLILLPGTVNTLDLLYLKSLSVKYLKLDYYSDVLDEYTIDLGLFPNLEFLFSKSSRNFTNISECTALKTIIIQDWLECSLEKLSGCSALALKLCKGDLRHLNGLKKMHSLCSLSISYQRKLSDVSELSFCTYLESLWIEKCPKADLKTIPSVKNLRYLYYSSTKSLADLHWLSSFPRLQYLVLDAKIEDGNLKPLAKLKHCELMTDHKHYLIKNNDLPKAERFCSLVVPQGYEVIPGGTVVGPPVQK